jgi:thymidine phosphorylase
MKARAIITDGTQPVGRGIGPALEAQDVLSVLSDTPNAPEDLRERALLLAGALLELGGKAKDGQGLSLAEATLRCGQAKQKFQQICEAQGGMRHPPKSAHRKPIIARAAGRITAIDNRRLARVAKLAGAPNAKAAGVELNVSLGDDVNRSQPLYVVHAESPGELSYALEYASANDDIYKIAAP